MKIIINNSSMVPIYEQLMEQIKTMILNEELKRRRDFAFCALFGKRIKNKRSYCKKGV